MTTDKKKAVWVQGRLEPNGDIIISLGEDGYYRIPADTTIDGTVLIKK